LNSKSTTPIPGPIEQLQRQLDEFRGTQPHRTKLPETLWQAAVELARQHGVYSVAHPLPGSQKKAVKPAFVELIADRAATMADFVIEFESSIGGKMRIHWKSCAAPDWASLLRAWRDAER